MMNLSGLRAFLMLCAAFSLAACGGSSPSDGEREGVDTLPGGDPSTARTRYDFANQCFVLASEENGHFVRRSGDGYAADAESPEEAEAFFMKPAALGDYLFYDRDGGLIFADGAVSRGSLGGVGEEAVFRLLADGDETVYALAPFYDQEPSPEMIDAYRGFDDPLLRGTRFTLDTGDGPDTQRLAVDEGGALVLASTSESDAQRFRFVAVSGCAEFPEAQDNTIGETFSGTLEDGSVLGMADVHVHVSATTFLGGAQHGAPFSRFGVTDALGSCEASHGPNGTLDAVGALLGSDFDGHATDGWPTFTDWPARDMVTHEAIYWKWLERGWKAGLRLIVNDVVDNETLCKIQRNVSGTPLRNCNEMDNAAAQVGSMYAMQDYIDAQYGGPGEGWFRIVLSPSEAREVIADGKLAVVLGVEISNLFDCQLTYNPLRTQEPFEETGEGLIENRYACAMTETGADNEIATQLARLEDLGIRQFITIHEFDNAFGGNGIFDALVLNVGNRENTGGIPDAGQVVENLQGALGPPSETSPLGNFIVNSTEAGTGEFWTTYDCPTIDDPEVGGGFIDGSDGQIMQSLPGPCLFAGQGGRPGGPTPCYPTDKPQCNARWMTPIGLYTYEKLMERGMLFDIDHLEHEMKTQALELAEAQDITYPLISTHGTFGITSHAQARRMLAGGGFIYPSLANGPRHLERMDEVFGLAQDVGEPHLFGFGFGTDTNGLATQTAPRGEIEPGEEVRYPYTLFKGAIFDAMPEFDSIAGVTFEQPEERNAEGMGRTWQLDVDGSAHYGMLSGFVEEVRQEGSVEQMRHLFNSAEAYLRTWERTVAAGEAIREKGFVIPEGVLRPAPTPDSSFGG